MDERLEDLLENLISYGDLVEAAVQEAKGETARPALVYLAPLQIVPLKDQSILILGIEPDDQTAIPEAMSHRIKQTGYVRRLYGASSDMEHLVGLGFSAVPEALWLKAPPPVKPGELIAAYNKKLEHAPLASRVAGAQRRALRVRQSSEESSVSVRIYGATPSLSTEWPSGYTTWGVQIFEAVMRRGDFKPHWMLQPDSSRSSVSIP
jgi:hypothetical protein